jgi:predicted Zn-dependent peptidase
LNTILGDGMSSRLFIEIRERLGLAYTVYSSIGFLQDTGSFAVYAGVDPEKLTSAIRAVLAELERVRRETVTDEELRAAKEYVKGRLLLRLEDTAANASWVGSQALLGKEIITPDEVIRCVDEVTASDVRRVAEDLIQENRMVLSVVGPVDTEADWEQLLRLA